MNTIPTDQATEMQLRRLAAQSHLYSTAKRVLATQVVLGAPLAVLLAIGVAIFPTMKGGVATWSLLVVLADLLWLTPWQKGLRESAAKVQEAFDCDVLQIPWNEIKVGKRPDAELIKAAADKYLSNIGNLNAFDKWYPEAVGSLPLSCARIICQRANCWWDAKQRKDYARWILSGLAVVGIVIFALGFVGGLSVDKLMLVVVLPLAPAALLAIRQYSEHSEAATKLQKLKEHAEKVWDAALNRSNSRDLLPKCRALQDEIFDSRKRSPLIFDWIFRRLRGGYEAQMTHGAEELVAQAAKKIGSPATPDHPA